MWSLFAPVDSRTMLAISHEFDRKAVPGAADSDTLNKAAQDINRLRSGLGIPEHVLEAANR